MPEMPTPTKEQLLDLIIALGDVRVQGLDNTHDYVSGTTHFYDDLDPGAFLGDEYVLTTVTTTDGFLRADPATIANVLTGEFVVALFVFVWTGSGATSPILVFVEKNADLSAMNREGVTGEDITAYPPDYILHL